LTVILSGLKKELAGMEEELQNCVACDSIKIQEKKRAVVLAKFAGLVIVSPHRSIVANPESWTTIPASRATF